MATKRTRIRRQLRKRLAQLHRTGMHHTVRVKNFKLGFTLYGPDDPRFAEMKRRQSPPYTTV